MYCCIYMYMCIYQNFVFPLTCISRAVGIKICLKDILPHILFFFFRKGAL